MSPGINRGDSAPDFELPDQTGTVRSLSGLLADGPIVLFFYPAAMTLGCTKEACHFRDLAAGSQQWAPPASVSVPTRSTSRPGSPTPSASTTRCCPTQTARWQMFGVKRGLLGKFMPVKRTTFVIDTDRTVLEVISSEVNMDTHADQALEGTAGTLGGLGAGSEQYLSVETGVRAGMASRAVLVDLQQHGVPVAVSRTECTYGCPEVSP